MKNKGLANKNIKWWIGIISCVVLFSTILIFGYEKMCFVLNGVEINATISEVDNSSIAKVSGNASKAVLLTLNGREIYVDKYGNFSEIISVLPGFSVVTLNAKDKFGKIAEKKFEIIHGENAEAIAFKNIGIIN